MEVGEVVSPPDTVPIYRATSCADTIPPLTSSACGL